MLILFYLPGVKILYNNKNNTTEFYNNMSTITYYNAFLQDFTRPFVDLITFSYRWFLKKNIWMRGDFDTLTLPEIEITVDEFYR